MRRNISETATEFLRRLASGDFDRVREMCNDTATVWHNDGVGEQAIGEKLDQLELLMPTVHALEYDVFRQFQNDDEVLQQQVLRLELADGSCREVHAAMHLRFEGDLIDRIEEYTYVMPRDQEIPLSGGRQL
ncbi:Limonene-1,2-epoxide hydrolase catalytic domain [Saccharopolyspora antimicrobica]|uniref:Limonene-1,2-epoxide hydrolase catalytic domain n=2 Tax=Saccharopolyspora antimicrobica TaxID=455193 RepID=A0A1I5JXF3_9PSEU|nr:limonene-1,2-epoxide hydrolase catalytic subunit [Saccharopolyspora antimicrobica]SFO77465.1 Limonene-1,2-epoxide hydrolase catalytic domain [Saccharopolyspora antimicrobica]